MKQAFVAEHFKASLEAMQRAAADPDLADAVQTIADLVVKAIRKGGKLLIAGNGGSAGDAQHIAGEFVSRLNFDRAPLPAISLTTDTSIITAVGNDYGFDKIFERQIQCLARPGDVFLAISTSGRSPNIINALKAARALGVVTVGFTGDGQREMERLCDVTLHAPARETPLIQQIHIVAAHAMCGLVEVALFSATEHEMEQSLITD